MKTKLLSILAVVAIAGMTGNIIIRASELVWTVEDWDGSYGAIAQSVDIWANAEYIFTGWSLNNERISAYLPEDSGNPLWEYDLLDGQYSVSGTVLVAGMDYQPQMVAAVSGRTKISETNIDSELFCLNISDGSIFWSDIMPLSSSEPQNTENIVLLRASSFGWIAVVAHGQRYTAPMDPIHIYFYMIDGTQGPTFEIADPDGSIAYVNDIRFTQESSNMLVVDFRMTEEPSHMVKTFSLVTAAEVQSWTIENSPPQNEIGLSYDGSVLAIGDLYGKIRVYHFNNATELYELAWTHTIRPVYYYPWVTSIDVSQDGSRVAVGSYQPDQTSNHGYLYVFDAQSGPPILYKSPDAGDYVNDVAISSDGSVAFAASWGPLPGSSGWDLFAYSENLDTCIFELEGQTPGSVFACDISSSGEMAISGGKYVHARDFGSGGYLRLVELEETPWWTPEPTATPETTATPTPAATDTPQPTVTPTCPPDGAELTLSQSMLGEGDNFLLTLKRCNNSNQTSEDNPVCVVLSAYGSFYFAPGWGSDLQGYREQIPLCDCTTMEILNFNWPANTGAGEAAFYGAMLDPEMTTLIGNLSYLPFAWNT